MIIILLNINEIRGGATSIIAFALSRLLGKSIPA